MCTVQFGCGTSQQAWLGVHLTNKIAHFWYFELKFFSVISGGGVGWGDGWGWKQNVPVMVSLVDKLREKKRKPWDARPRAHAETAKCTTHTYPHAGTTQLSYLLCLYLDFKIIFIKQSGVFVHPFFCFSFAACLLHLPPLDSVVLLLSVLPVFIKLGIDWLLASPSPFLPSSPPL